MKTKLLFSLLINYLKTTSYSISLCARFAYIHTLTSKHELVTYVCMYHCSLVWASRVRSASYSLAAVGQRMIYTSQIVFFVSIEHECVSIKLESVATTFDRNQHTFEVSRAPSLHFTFIFHLTIAYRFSFTFSFCIHRRCHYLLLP